MSVAESHAARSIVVAGGTGFIGRVVSARLRAAGHRVVILARGRRSAPLEGVELRRCELGAPVEAELLRGCEVLINLVGIKRETQAMSFERAHVQLPLEFAQLSERLGLTHMIHVSVAGANDPDARGVDASLYLETKARGELELRQRDGALPLTIVRPGVVYGPGDDMLRNLADSIRAAPLVPAPRGGRAQLAPLAVEDLAEALLRCVEQPPLAGEQRAYDIVGPETLALRELIARVAAHPMVARRCWVVPAPARLQALVAHAFERASSDPLITRGQLDLLARGVVGDLEPARRKLALEPRALDAAAIDAALAEFTPRLPSVRLVPDPRATFELHERGGAASPRWLVLFALLAIASLLLGPLIPASIWLRMASLELLLTLVALFGAGMAWTKLWRPSAASLAWGVGVGALMVLGAHGVALSLGRVAPGLWSEAASIYSWAAALPPARALLLLTIIVAGEEFVWRGALGLGLVARLGPWLAVLASALCFTLAHLTTGPPLLALAAALAGGAWTMLAIRSRSLFAPFIAHLGWDVTMLWLLPMGGF